MTVEAIQEIELWLEKTKTAPSRLGLLSTANPRAVQRIRDGTARVSTLEDVLRYIRANPPAKRRSRRKSGAER